MATYIEINPHPVDSSRIEIKLNAVAPVKNYKSLAPLKSQVLDYRECYNPPGCIEIIMGTNMNYIICALPVYAAYAAGTPEEKAQIQGVMPIEAINGVNMNTNSEVLTALQSLLIP